MRWTWKAPFAVGVFSLSVSYAYFEKNFGISWLMVVSAVLMFGVAVDVASRGSR